MSIDPASRPVTLCQELVRLESPSGGEGPVADAVEREMRALAYDEVSRDELGSVIGVVRGARPGNTVLLDAHMDVVAATQPEAWRFPPFSGELAEGRVWGRGATDIKGSLAAALVAVGTLPRAELAGTLVMSASVGEELVEGLAVRNVLERHPAQAVVICEPTGLKLGLGHRGRASVVVTAAGKAAHTSRPENGINAVYRLCDAIALIRDMPRRADELLGAGHIVLVEISSKPFPASSMVPYEAVARFDRRLVRGESRESVLSEMRAVVAAVEGTSVSLHDGGLSCYTGRDYRVEAFHPGWAVERDSEIARRAVGALERAGLAREIFYAPFCTNGSATAGELGIPTVVYGAGEISEAHAIDEGVAAEALLAACRGYRALALALAG